MFHFKQVLSQAVHQRVKSAWCLLRGTRHSRRWGGRAGRSFNSLVRAGYWRISVHPSALGHPSGERGLRGAEAEEQFEAQPADAQTRDPEERHRSHPHSWGHPSVILSQLSRQQSSRAFCVFTSEFSPLAVFHGSPCLQNWVPCFPTALGVFQRTRYLHSWI